MRSISRYQHLLLTAGFFAFTPVSFVTAADRMQINPEAAEAQAERTPPPSTETQHNTEQPNAAADQHTHDKAATTRNPEADRRDMEQRYPTTPHLDEHPSDKSKEVGS